MLTMQVGVVANFGSAELVRELAENSGSYVLSIQPVKPSPGRILRDLRAELADAKQARQQIEVLPDHPVVLSAQRSLSQLRSLAGSLHSPKGVRVAGDAELAFMFEIVGAHIELLQQRGILVPEDPPAHKPQRKVWRGAPLAAAVRLTRGDLIPSYLKQLRAAAERAEGLAERSKKVVDRAQYRALADLVTKAAEAMDEGWSPLR